MASGKDNLSQSFSVLTQKQFDKFLRDYQILGFLNPELPASYKPDLNVLRYFYEFIMARDWYMFAHRKNVPSPSSEEKLSLENWMDNFFWLDDLCLPVNMVWRFKDQSMDFELGETLFLTGGRVCHNYNQWDKEWPVIRRKGEENVISLRDTLKVPNFANLDFDIVEDTRDGVSLVKQIALAAYAIRPLVDPEMPVPNSAVSESGAEARGSSGVQAVIDVPMINEDSDMEIRELDREL
ncbi:hypothetical protein Hanom_Chr10g00942561 [Helianthus anomalus]